MVDLEHQTLDAVECVPVGGKESPGGFRVKRQAAPTAPAVQGRGQGIPAILTDEAVRR